MSFLRDGLIVSALLALFCVLGLLAAGLHVGVIRW